MAVVLLLVGCSTTPNFVAQYEPWRNAEERSCLSSGAVRQTSFIRTRSALGGPSVCGAEQPFEMAAAGDGRVILRPPAMLRCPMIPQVERWVSDVVEPAARFHFQQPVVEITVAASYSCRAINHKSGGRLSEHGYANALDVSAVTLADGSTFRLKSGWRGSYAEQGFWRDIHRGACQYFTTVLGPEADRYHLDNMHMDLARHGRDGLRRICQ